MDKFFEKIAAVFSSDIASTILTVILLFALFFYLMNLLQRNNAKWLIAVMFAYVALTGVVYMLFMHDKTDKNPFTYFLVLTPFVVIVFVLFATEIKRDIWDKKQRRVSERKQEYRRNRQGSPEYV